MPEVSLVAILDADKEGFLRSDRSLIQTVGRAARNVRGRAIMYAASVTGSMQRAIDETNRRREKQEAHNKAEGITPTTINKKVLDVMEAGQAPVPQRRAKRKEMEAQKEFEKLAPKDAAKKIASMEKQMFRHARDLEFEEAAAVRDKIDMLKQIALGPGTSELS